MRSWSQELLSPRAALYQQSEFDRAAEDERDAGNWRRPGSVRGFHGAPRPLWPSEECSGIDAFKDSLMFGAVFPSFLWRIRDPEDGCGHLDEHTRTQLMTFSCASPETILTHYFYSTCVLNYSFLLLEQTCCTSYSTTSFWRLQALVFLRFYLQHHSINRLFVSKQIHHQLCWFQPPKCEDLLLFLSFMISNKESLGFGQLVGQKKQFEDVSLEKCAQHFYKPFWHIWH